MAELNLKPGQRIRVERTIRTREGDWKTSVEGEVVYVEHRPTGSWFAHGKNDKLWLQRVRIKKSDGELAELVLERDAKVKVLGNGAAA